MQLQRACCVGLPGSTTQRLRDRSWRIHLTRVSLRTARTGIQQGRSVSSRFENFLTSTRPSWFRPEKRLLSTARMTAVQSRGASRAATRCASRISPSRSPRRAPTSTRSPWRLVGSPARKDARSRASLNRRARPLPSLSLKPPKTLFAPRAARGSFAPAPATSARVIYYLTLRGGRAAPHAIAAKLVKAS